MNRKNALTKEQLHAFSKPILEDMAYRLLIQVDELNEKVSELSETVNVLKGSEFGRHTEKQEELPPCFNDSEVITDKATEEEKAEPTLSDLNPLNSDEPAEAVKKAHAKGRRTDELKALPVKQEPYRLKDEQSGCECGGTFREIHSPSVTHRLVFKPAEMYVEEQLIYSYKCDRCGKLVRADHPLPVFEGSLATPSLLAGIATAKFSNASTYYRLENGFVANCAFLSRQTMARWMIRTADVYFSLIVDRMKQELLSCGVIHADETTVEVSKDGRSAGAKSYMWVYTKEGSERPVVIYEYQKTRAATHPKEFLADYIGWLCCDGYEAYHSLPDSIRICGCWAHARRHYANAVKALSGNADRVTELAVSQQALQTIGEMFHLEEEWKNLSREEHLIKRKTVMKEKIDSYYRWIDSVINAVPPKSETGKGLRYSLNQKDYLLAFLENPDVPMDNSEAERKIRNFVISRKNFILIDTVSGAEASAVMFSMSETARANHLNPYAWYEYLLTELPKHLNQKSKDMSFLDDLMPWSGKLPEGIHKN